MSLLGLFLAIILIGVIVWAITTFIPIPAQFKQLIMVVGIIVAVLMVLQAFGILPALQNVQVPQVR